MTFPFVKADILIPRRELLPGWSVVACDQFTSEPEYWAETERIVGEKPSSLRIMLPEAYLSAPDVGERIAAVNGKMSEYLSDGVFERVPNCFVYVERTLPSGAVRHGVVGALDLTMYDYAEGLSPAVRATEGTVLSRIPPRVQIRQNAPLEMPHVMLLADDPENKAFSVPHDIRGSLPLLYDFELMQNGGHITGRLLSGETADRFAKAVSELGRGGMTLAVGDGNHSLASAKVCFENLREKLGDEAAMRHPARYALCELVNVHDSGLAFEPIHRLVTGVDPDKLIAFVAGSGGIEISAVTESGYRKVSIPIKSGEPVCGALQAKIDEYLAVNGGAVDYIHGSEAAVTLGMRPGCVAFILPAFDKTALFPTVLEKGRLPRKAFSMGEANEKRYYLECRKIK